MNELHWDPSGSCHWTTYLGYLHYVFSSHHSLIHSRYEQHMIRCARHARLSYSSLLPYQVEEFEDMICVCLSRVDPIVLLDWPELISYHKPICFVGHGWFATAIRQKVVRALSQDRSLPRVHLITFGEPTTTTSKNLDSDLSELLRSGRLTYDQVTHPWNTKGSEQEIIHRPARHLIPLNGMYFGVSFLGVGCPTYWRLAWLSNRNNDVSNEQ